VDINGALWSFSDFTSCIAAFIGRIVYGE